MYQPHSNNIPQPINTSPVIEKPFKPQMTGESEKLKQFAKFV